MAILQILSSSYILRPPCTSHTPCCYKYHSHEHYAFDQQSLHMVNHRTPGSQSCKTSFRVASPRSTPYARKATTQEGEFLANDCLSAMPDMPSVVVKEFYERINKRRHEDLGDLIAEDCVYEDFVYPKPFQGRQAILSFFKKFMDSLSQDLTFVIDDISKDDSAVVAVAWHLEWRGRHFPFSKGCSFYRCDILDGKTQIVYGRDSVEPATKPGDFALVAIRAVTTLFERFPQLAERL